MALEFLQDDEGRPFALFTDRGSRTLFSICKNGDTFAATDSDFEDLVSGPDLQEVLSGFRVMLINPHFGQPHAA